MALVKVNFRGLPPESLAFRFLPSDQLAWEPCPEIPDADTLLSGKRAFLDGAGKAKDDDLDADTFLRDLLQGDPVESEQVYKEGKKAGFPRNQLDKAKKRLKIKPRKLDGVKDGPWVWELPSWEKGHFPEEEKK